MYWIAYINLTRWLSYGSHSIQKSKTFCFRWAMPVSDIYFILFFCLMAFF